MDSPHISQDLSTKPNTLSTDLNKLFDVSSGRRIIGLVILISFIFGMVGGTLGSVYLTQLPGVQKLMHQQVLGGSQNQKIVLEEDSAVIDVVGKASPAVVSIVITKDLSKVPGFGVSPFELDPFSQFFGFGFSGNQPQRSTEPNLQQVGAGSGFFVSADGLVFTNRHVVSDEQASYTVITNEGKSYEARVLTRDPVNDLAILKIDIQNAPTLSLTDSSQLQIGQRVIAIGNSLGQYQNTVTTGVVSGIGRSITAGGGGGSEQLEGVIQTDAAINPGNSGGPLLNVVGQVIGINTAIDREGQLVGFAIPASDAKRALESFQKTGKISRPFLGVRYVMITKVLADKEKLPKDYGALLSRGQTVNEFAVVPGSPADKAGLVENDIILEVNGKKVEGSHTLTSLLKDFSVGQNLSLKIYHRGEEKTVTVSLGEK